MTAIRKVLGIVVLMCVTAPMAVSAQESASPPPSKVERKNRAPVSAEILQAKIPKAIEARLKNGLAVLIIEDRRFPALHVDLHLRSAGALFEPASSPGLASATARMLREGTTTRASEQIAAEIDRLGATLSASSGFGSPEVVLSASGLSGNFDAWFAVFSDVLLHPAFPASELGKLKQRLKVQLRQQRANAGFLLEERFSRAVYGGHPAAIISPTVESVDAFTPEALARWHRERYSPRDSIFAIAGDVRAAELMPRLETALGRWQQNEIKAALPPNAAPASSRRIYLVDRPDSVQTTLVLGNIAIDRRHEDYIPLVVMNYIFGGGPAARLFLNLREEKGYTYGVYSSFSAGEYPGPWRAGGNMRTEVTAGAVTEFFREIRRMRDEKVSDAELAEARRAIVARFALSLEQPAQVLGFALTKKIYNFPDDYWETYPAKVAAVGAEDVARVARKYLDPETMQIVAVGDTGKIKPILERYGPVEVYDSGGKPAPEPKP
jgi:zinc protease